MSNMSNSYYPGLLTAMAGLGSYTTTVAPDYPVLQQLQQQFANAYVSRQASELTQSNLNNELLLLIEEGL